MGPICRASPCLHTVGGGTLEWRAWCRHPAERQPLQGSRRHSSRKSHSSAGSAPMSDDENHFRPRPGRIRSDARGGAKTKSFFTKVKKIARQHGGSPSRGARAAATGRAAKDGSRSALASGRGVKRGRGAAFVRARNLSDGWSHRQPGSRRVIVKSRSVRAAGKNGRAAAICATFSATEPRATASAASSTRRPRIAPTAMPSSIAARMTATSSA